ncbi:MAG TPA: isocitrate lyase [Candidatus Polarisedimenticolia bacterium]|nr:isocitrate lyase [Candidatus Polarisedimenticolia bacterium]
MPDQKQADLLTQEWTTSPRWRGVVRPYPAAEVVRLRGSLRIDYTLATRGAMRLWELLHAAEPVRALGALTGNQAIQQVAAGLKAIYCSGWQVAGDANDALQMYPDQSLYPVSSVPRLVQRINNALTRADQIQHMRGKADVDWFAPIVADAEAGFGGTLNAFELMKGMIEAGAAGVHFEDQLSSLKKCGHMGGKVLVPVQEFVPKLAAARLAADILGVPTLLVARTDALGANLIRGLEDPVDAHNATGATTPDGFHVIRGGIDYAIEKGRAYAPYSDLIWCETSKPDIGEAKAFAQGIHEKFPGKMLAYNCSPSFNWKRHLDDQTMASFQETLAGFGYRFQFVTLAGFHALNTSMFDLALNYRREGMLAYSRLQQQEFDLEKREGYAAVKHQAFVGAGYFDEIQLAVTGGAASTTALRGSTEEEQFHDREGGPAPGRPR